jgi:aldehyde dehydrogenase (NAD+)
MQDLIASGNIQRNREYGLFIGGQSIPATSGDSLPVINPSDGQTVCSIAAGNAADIAVAVKAAQQAFATD